MDNSSASKCYVYKHVTKNMPDGKPPYVYYGKGTDRRAWNKSKRHQFWQNVFTKYEYDIIILKDNLTDDEAFQYEKELIKTARNNNEQLVNLLDGGLGFSTIDAKKLYENPEHREKMHHASIIRSSKPEFRQKVSQGVRHKIQTDPAFAKRWKEKSKTMDIETYRNKAKVRWQDPEYRKNQMEARQKSPKVLENCRKMRAKIRPEQERTVMSPDGTIHTFFNAKQFSETHQLSYDAFLKLLLGKQRQHKGWKLYNPL